MSVGAVNNNQQQTYAIPGAMAGLGTGAVAGTTYGYLSKSWLKDGNITDQFIRQADKAILDLEKKSDKQIFEDLKKMQETGSIDGVSEHFKSAFKNSGLENMTAEQRKVFVRNYVQQMGAENLEDLKKIVDTRSDFQSITGTMKWAEKCKSLTEKTPVEDLNKLLKESRLENVLGTATQENKKQIIEVLQDSCDVFVESRKLETRACILEYVDTGKKSMKELASNADYEDKSLHNAIKKAMRNVNLKSAAKWGAIGAGVLGALGLGIGAMNNKKS